MSITCGLGWVRLGCSSITISLLVYSHPVTSLPLSYYWFVLIPLQVPFHNKMGITSKMYGTTNQNIWVLQIKCMIITNRNVWALQIKCIVTTNQNIWSIQMKCMLITSQMYSHYKSNHIQFLTLGGSHDCLYKPSKFPFLVSHMTCLSKHLIPPVIFAFW